MSGNDLFSDESFGTFSSYSQRNQEAVRAERAADADKRIAEFAARKKTLEWANEALDFCKREREAGKDIADISTGIQDLPRILAEAQAIIEKDKRERENERLAAAEKERRARERDAQAVLDKINEIDTLISDLANAPESSYWCDEVVKAEGLVNAAPSNIRLKLKNLPTLDRLLERVKELREAYEIAGKIDKLKRVKKKDQAWAKGIIDALALLNSENRRDVAGADYLDASKEEAYKLLRADKVREYRLCLEEAEGEDCSGCIEKYRALDGELPKLGYSVGKYIDGFDARWRAVKSVIDETDAKIKAENAERERRRAEERRIEAEKTLAEYEAKKKRERAAAAVKTVLKAALIVAVLAVAVAAAIFVGISGGEYSPWIISFIVAIAYVLFFGIGRRTELFAATRVNLTVGMVVTAASAIAMFFAETSLYALFGVGAVLVSSFVMITNDSKKDKDYIRSAFLLNIAVGVLTLNAGFALSQYVDDAFFYIAMAVGTVLVTVVGLILVHNYRFKLKKIAPLGIVGIVFAAICVIPAAGCIMDQNFVGACILIFPAIAAGCTSLGVACNA